MNDVRAALALQMIQDIGPATSKVLIDTFGSPSEVFDVGMDRLLSMKGLAGKRAEKLTSFSGWKLIDQVMEECEQKDVHIIYYGSTEYPALLAQVTDPPTVIYYKGTFSPHDKYAISIVGSRRATSYGKSIAQHISEGLSSMGFTIVSGMARGIDCISHIGAIKKGGRTIAVLGSGIDVIYPPESLDLYRRIQDQGAVISEFPLGTEPLRENFPRRNRVISGLSLGVIVVEAAKGSGTLITAQSALEQNREVFSVPGNISSSNSYGTNALLKKGAKLITHPDDVVEELSPLLKGFIRAEKKEQLEFSAEERQLCDILSGEPVHIDEITRKAGFPSAKVLGLLLGLELRSVVRQMEGKKFFLIQEEQRV
jgi:DNA processing protein